MPDIRMHLTIDGMDDSCGDMFSILVASERMDYLTVGRGLILIMYIPVSFLKFSQVVLKICALNLNAPDSFLSGGFI